ncbi:jasmonate-induced protein homolog isoform X2 [Silene latifolia]|uniref:jasmonate-induced protein homolog isoform X2 n=1 Tax=Silene latifolia TaxID=37657 RepID=UPI003D77903D
MLNVKQKYYIKAIQRAMLVHNNSLSNNHSSFITTNLFCFSSNQDMASAQVVLQDKVQNGTSGTLNNQTPADMQLLRSFSFDGSFVGGAPPANISGNGGVGHFTHLKGSQASMAAVCYSITTATGQPGAAILGWIAPANFNPTTSPNKVFGAIGPRAIIDQMSWDQIQNLMVKAGSSIEVCFEGVCMHATILNNPTAKMADLLANFSYLCPKP